MRPTFALLPATCLALALAMLAGPVAAAELVRMSVVDRDTGRSLPQYHDRGQAWIAGVPGHRYAVHLHNASDERVLVVLSVDGINAVTGEDADPLQSGYVLDPWQDAEIAGWRKSLDDVAQFVFTDLPDSYAARTDRPDNIGVIGIAVFRERRPLPRAPLYLPQADAARDAASMPPSAAAAESADASVAAVPQRQRVGTGHGQREWAPVGQTGFERNGTRPVQLSQLRYDDRAALVARGILRPAWQPSWPRPPQAFPGGFVPDPPLGD